MTAFLPVQALSALSQQAQSMVATANAQSFQGPAAAMAPSAAAEPVMGSFGQFVSDGLSKVNGQLIGSQVDLQKLAMGDARNLHQIMINMEESRVSFQLMMQVRSRLLEAYQDVMKMPI
ncbi:flagellar hook-basal body complex protein FliE [Variovorax boronicumulans]|uniref:flagellar hook-basal body complex protein FliE n=1 Tax=Variovorax boronicumulans TaxID=436515 RepID=UPI00277FF37F|nr:flagellar hook-basal body complex protein FliE [Variovorax boronicumulans]MDQ0086093.1 flagellar hook-basal body complex protein FliE [Variovorax boronicumulans]